jgi:GT2 family glycosyltransferase
MRQVSVIILAYGDEPFLVESVRAALDSRDVDVELLLVDNGSSSISRVAPDPRLRVITPGVNTGFAGGCNLAAAQASHDTLVFANSDLILRPDAIAVLTSQLEDTRVGLATGAVLMPGQPPKVNSIGNPIHYLLFSWAGAFGEPFVDHDAPERVAGISGAFFACRRTHWEWLGGFDEQFFAYAEDADLSLRTWQSGRTVTFEPRAIGVHHYAFTKNNNKWFLLERNRLMALFTLYDRRSIWLLLPVLLPVELGVLASARSNGWAKEKLASWRWLWGHRAYLHERRQRVAARHVAPLHQWTDVMSGEMHIPEEFGLRVPAPVNWVLGRYWRLVKPFIK